MRALLVATAWLWLGAAAQAAWAERLSVGPAYPDFLLILTVLLSMHRTSDAAAATGFFAGVLHGAIQNMSLAALAVSRTLAAVAASRIAEASVGRTYLTVVGATGICTIIAGILYLFFGLEKNILGWLTATIGAAIYNAVLAAAFYWVYRVVVRPSTAT